MFSVKRSWVELGDDGGPVEMRWVEFGSISEQLMFLRNMIDTYRGTQRIRTLAMRIITEAGCPDRNHACMALAIGEWVQKHIRYVREFPERFQTPVRTVIDGAGDCDDHTTLIGSLLESIGIPMQVVGMKVDGKWKHVFPRALIDVAPGRQAPLNLDSTLRNTPIRTRANPIQRALARGMKVETLVL